jgi:hypothetical protein
MCDARSTASITAASIPARAFNLRDKMPKAGMLYPFKDTLMKRGRTDNAILTAIKAGTGARRMTTDLLDDTFSNVFREATDLLQNAKQRGQISRFEDDPIALIFSIRRLPALQDIWMRRNLKFLVGIFLLLRAARQRWHKTPTYPNDLSKHGKMAQEIDKFLAVETLDWGSIGVVEWLLREIIIPANKESDSEAILTDFASGMDVEQQDGKAQFQVSLEAVMLGMRRLNIDVS